MAGCILTSADARAHRAQMAIAAAAVGSKIMPRISQFCEACGTHHTVEMEGEAVDRNYGLPPVEVHLTPAEEKQYQHFQHNTYCGVCKSHHGDDNCPGPREVTPSEFGNRRNPGIVSA